MKRLLAILAFAAIPAFAQTRIASDFELRQMQKQAAEARDFLSLLQARLNLGDLHRTRSELTQATAEYRRALALANKERVTAREAGDIARYVTGTMYAALAKAKLGDERAAFTLLEEATRYESDEAKTWNIYAIAMAQVREPRKAVAAARNAVTLADAALARSATIDHRIDAALYHFSLGSALIEAGEHDDAVRELERVIASLSVRELDAVRRSVARGESFEIYATTRGDAAAYLSIYNKAHLALARLMEQRGDSRRARELYEAVLALRTDDATALAGLARLAPAAEERERRYAEAFDANPFSLPLVREYQRWLRTNAPRGAIDDSTTGGKVRKALVQLARGESRAARETLQALAARHPDNRTLQTLLGETELDARFATLPSPNPTAEELRRVIALFAADRLTPEQRVTLDAATYVSNVIFTKTIDGAAPGQTIFESGTIDGVPFRFAEPIAFAGTFAANTPLRLTYRVLGATEVDGADALLLEPLQLEVRQ